MPEHKGKTALDQIMAGLDGVTEGLCEREFQGGRGSWIKRRGSEGDAEWCALACGLHDTVANANAAHIARCDPDTMRDIAAYAAVMREALERIAIGDGVYGAQAHEYKQIARAALKFGEVFNG